MKYEYYDGREVVSALNDKSKWLKCCECGAVRPSAKLTKDKKIVCLNCYFKDEDGEL
jgi:formylmethanofuran dehydrogenase subunit E